MTLDDVELRYVRTYDDAGDMLRWLGERHDGELATDTETTGLNPEVDRVRLVQLGDSRTGWAIPFERWSGVYEDAVTRYDGKLLMHNAKFDYAMLRKHSIDVGQHRVHDTRLMAHVLQPTYSTALKKSAARLVDPRAAQLQSDLQLSHNDGGTSKSRIANRKAGWTWETVPVDYAPYWQYGALDTVLTSQLHTVLDPELDNKRCRAAYDLELAASFVCETMERNGVPIDLPYVSEAIRDFTARAEGLAVACEVSFGMRPGANGQVAQYLIDAGYPLSKTTATGAIELTKEVLGPIDHPLADAVIQYRRLTKLVSTYLRHFNAEWIHPRINSCQARTGRMSMEGPNLQNLPRKADANPDAIAVRNSICAPEGYTLLMIDFDQIEVRVLAHAMTLLGYTSLVEAFATPEDFFVTIARQIFNDPSLAKSDPRRQVTKNFVYGQNYGAGTAKLAVTAGVTEEQAEIVAAGLNRAHPGIKVLQRHVEQQAIARIQAGEDAYVRSFLTGRRHPADGDALYTLINYLVQGTAAEIFKLKLVELANAGLDQHLILPIHDEAIFCVPNEDLHEVARAAGEVMGDSQLLAVPISAGASVGQRWGQKIDYVPENQHVGA